MRVCRSYPVAATKAWIVAMALALCCVANLRGQAAGQDLPLGLRSLAGVTLNRDSAATIRAKLGHTRERRIGVGHDAYTSWCYVPIDSSPNALVELLSDAGELGTPGQTLNVIRLRDDASVEDRSGCALLRTPVELSTPAGLRLGLHAADIEQLLGPPRRSTADSLIYYFDAKEYLPPNSPEYEIWNTPEHRETCFDAGLPYANVGASVIVVLRDGRVAEMRIERQDQSIC
jgi:hypothetical protein